MLPALLGIVGGLGELFLLTKLVDRITDGTYKGLALLGFMNIALLFVVLGVSAWLWREQVLYAGLGLIGVLVIGAIVFFIVRRQK